MNLKLFLLCLSANHIFSSNLKPPTVLISILARNKAHTLPFFLTLIGKLNYPKERIALWIRTDHNIDKTAEILKTWIESVEKQYHFVDFQSNPTEKKFKDEKSLYDWSNTRFFHVINLREGALLIARKMWADYVWMLDCDTFPLNHDILWHMISKNLTVASPMLTSVSTYSNFWCGMTDDYYYQRNENYEPILKRQNVGCFEVPMIHSSVIINLRQLISDDLTYSPEKLNHDGVPIDDIITFAISAKLNQIPLYICNDHEFGYIMVPLDTNNNFSEDMEQLTSLKVKAIIDNQPLQVDDLLVKYLPSPPRKDKLGFDGIFMINLLRRPDRRKRMIQCFQELGLDVEIVDAVDGKSLNNSILQEIKFLPGYADPYHNRPMTLGEVGCFLSHYNIWRNAFEKGFDKILVLEDDIRFEPYFRNKMELLNEELDTIPLWDIVYLGRKKVDQRNEIWMSNSLVQASYSYWTLAYIISKTGVQKLLKADPLSKLLPVDEFLPIMYDKHSNQQWKDHFSERNLIALSASPLLIYPMKYTGEDGYQKEEMEKLYESRLHNEVLKSV